MYLSELFLKTLRGDYSISSIRNALTVCNAEFLKRIETIQFAERLDFWDVYCEFDSMFELTEKNNYPLLRQCLKEYNYSDQEI